MQIRGLPEEYLLRLEINDRKRVTLVCTGEALEELVTGYLFNEAVIANPEQIRSLQIDIGKKQACALLENPVFSGEVIRPSGLGGIQLSATAPEWRPVERIYTYEMLRRCIQELEQRAVKYLETGGVHCSLLFDGKTIFSLYEDIGRHNTLDKLCGDCLLRGRDARDAMLLTSGRISSDMVRKAARMGVSVIASCSTASDLALELACQANLTLISYAAKPQRSVLCVPERFI